MTDTLPLVVVMGVCGCGKSTLGTELADRLGVEFRDGDEFHPQANIDKMAAGHALDDDDRRPWLETISRWLSDQGAAGGVVACSALKHSYRDILRAHAPGVAMVHLAGPREEAARRVALRPGHFMPSSLVASQYATLQPLMADERGITLDFTLDVEALAAETLAFLR